MKRQTYLRTLLLCSLLIVALTGCGTDQTTGTVDGSVKLAGGAPVTEGMVNFYSKEKGIGGSGALDAQGSFKLTEPLPVGKYTVFIPPPLPTAPMPGVSTSRGPGSFAVPPKYQTELTSDLTGEVKPGKNSVALELSTK